MRLSGQAIKQLYIDKPYVQDIIETALMSGGSAAYQALFTDMDAGEIAQSTAVGAALGLGARPLGGMAGKHLGRKIDQVAPNAFDPYKTYLPVTRDGSAAYLNHMRKGAPGSNNEAARAFRDMLQAKRNLSGPDAGTAEAMLSYYLRNRADNIAQGGYALVSPFFTDGDDTNA
jgi:hypothetical protein